MIIQPLPLDVLYCTVDVYERAVSHVPPLLEKRYWTRYIYLWIYYALFEETMVSAVQCSAVQCSVVWCGVM